MCWVSFPHMPMHDDDGSKQLNGWELAVIRLETSPANIFNLTENYSNKARSHRGLFINRADSLERQALLRMAIELTKRPSK